MTETLSERLCKECGVEPLFLCKIHSETKCETVYPDFENNSNNFVKLLEILIPNDESDNSTLTSHINWNNPYWKNKKEYLETILSLFKENKTNLYNIELKELCEQIKQAIRNEQWEI